MALPSGRLAGPVWRIAPCGTTQVYFNRADGDRALVNSRGQIMRWAKQPMWVALDDLFETRVAARAEHRRRKDVAR